MPIPGARYFIVAGTRPHHAPRPRRATSPPTSTFGRGSVDNLLATRPGHPRSPDFGPPGRVPRPDAPRSSLNALRHGLGAVQAVLPGEDAAEYERRMEAVFEALAPANEVEAAARGPHRR